MKILPCPFCGSDAEIDENQYGYSASCAGFRLDDDGGPCRIAPYTGKYNTPEEAVKAWNIRSGVDAIDVSDAYLRGLKEGLKG